MISSFPKTSHWKVSAIVVSRKVAREKKDAQKTDLKKKKIYIYKREKRERKRDSVTFVGSDIDDTCCSCVCRDISS